MTKSQWIWQRGQQIFGAIVATGSVAVFLYCIVAGWMPGDLGYDLPNAHESTAYQLSSHDPRIDDGEIKQAIGLCHGIATDPVKSVSVKQEDIKSGENGTRSILFGLISLKNSAKFVPQISDALPAPLISWSNKTFDTRVSSFELSAISDSARIAADRLKYQEATRERQDRIRRYQISVLLLSAAASFLIGIKTLLSNNDNTVPFPHIMHGAWLPISVAALLVPVVATVYSGIIAFDDDSRVALRYARALAQLEQLHGRIVVDVTGDPLLCGLDNLDPNIYVASTVTPATEAHPTPGATKQPLKAIPANAYACLMSHEVKVKDWEQRYEQILNDASQTLAQAGDLAKGDSQPKPQPDDTVACKNAFDEKEKDQADSRSTSPTGDHPQVANAAPEAPAKHK